MANANDFIAELQLNQELQLGVQTLVRLLGAAFLGGMIGFERQRQHRAAGMRTHVLVAVGSALVMCTASYICYRYLPTEAPEFTRMGAQVISGVGFLGAGTILRDGFSIKGLTTAASLWAVACVGLAAGIGFWWGAVITTIILFLTLNSLKKVAKKHTRMRTIYIGVNAETHISEQVTELLHNCGVALRSLEVLFPDDPEQLHLNKDTAKVFKIKCYVDNTTVLDFLRENILFIDGVNDFRTDDT